MILHIEGDINPYYVQTLCMVFFPGSKFAKDEIPDEQTPVLYLSVSGGAGEVIVAKARLVKGNKETFGTVTVDPSADRTDEKRRKLAAGGAIFEAGKSMLRYTPPWGILTGVRPSKVAADLLRKGNTPARCKKILRDEYFLNPKKAALAVDVADLEMRLVSPFQKKRCSVYISIPFCPSRCTYCSFVSYTTPRLLSMIDDYLKALMLDLNSRFATINELGLEVATVYIGGGTPTILSASQLELLLAHIASLTDVNRLEEFTLEGGRPDTITAQKLKICRKYGVTRISVNPQTLNDDILAAIGRAHTVDDFLRAYDLVREKGPAHINVDLIAGLPSDNFLNFSETLDRIIELAPDNITVHTFCVKKSAELLHTGQKIYSRLGGDTAKSVSYAKIQTELSGYKPYYLYRQKNTIGNLENVGYAKEGTEGLYNIYMMEELHTIFAAGAGAVSKLVAPANGGHTPKICRIFSPKYPYEYLRNPEQAAQANEELHSRSIAFYNEYLR